MLRIVGYTILGALLGPIIWILLFHPNANDTTALYYGLTLGAILGLAIALFLDYHYRNYVQPPAQPITPATFFTGSTSWRMWAVVGVLIMWPLSYIIAAITPLDLNRAFFASFIIVTVVMWPIVSHFGSK